MAQDTQPFDLPSELWFKIIAFVLSDSIYAVCCLTTEEADLSWDRNAFGMLRLVSKSFGHTAIKVADLALAGRPWSKDADGNIDVDGEEKRITEPDNIKTIYDRFKLINAIPSNENAVDFFTQTGISLLAAYYGYVQLIKNCKTLFSRSAVFSAQSNEPTNESIPASQQHFNLMEKIYVLFPQAFRNITYMLDMMSVPEMVGKLRRDVEQDQIFISSGLEIVYRCAQMVNYRRDDWQSPDASPEFVNYLTGFYVIMKTSSEYYISELKNRVPGEFPAISELPGVSVAIKLIVSNGHHHQALSDMVNNWA